jgi:hypothetical protein
VANEYVHISGACKSILKVNVLTKLEDAKINSISKDSGQDIKPKR